MVLVYNNIISEVNVKLMSPSESQTDDQLTFRVHSKRRWGHHNLSTFQTRFDQDKGFCLFLLTFSCLQVVCDLTVIYIFSFIFTY